jgi:hypothetical protein
VQLGLNSLNCQNQTTIDNLAALNGRNVSVASDCD